jgi:hypothetical protein
MVVTIKESGSAVKDMVMAFMSGPVAQSTKETSNKTSDTEKAVSSMPISQSTMVNGQMINAKAKESSHGQMARFTQELLLMTRSRGQERVFGQTQIMSMWDNGAMERKVDKVQ